VSRGINNSVGRDGKRRGKVSQSLCKLACEREPIGCCLESCPAVQGSISLRERFYVRFGHRSSRASALYFEVLQGWTQLDLKFLALKHPEKSTKRASRWQHSPLTAPGISIITSSDGQRGQGSSLSTTITSPYGRKPTSRDFFMRPAC
jgi:hypothetical protein